MFLTNCIVFCRCPSYIYYDFGGSSPRFVLEQGGSIAQCSLSHGLSGAINSIKNTKAGQRIWLSYGSYPISLALIAMPSTRRPCVCCNVVSETPHGWKGPNGPNASQDHPQTIRGWQLWQGDQMNTSSPSSLG